MSIVETSPKPAGTGLVALPVIGEMAKTYGLDAPAFVFTFRTVAMPQPHTEPEFVSCLLVAREHGLNPLTKEIYFMRDKRGAIQALVGVDGWIRKCNEHRQFDGIEFKDNLDNSGTGVISSITCTIYRKDRSRPIVITEYMAECAQERKTAGPWQTHPGRMLRHRSLIQCARIAFGFAGIMEPDEFKAWQDRLKDVTPAAVEARAAPATIEPPDPDAAPAAVSPSAPPDAEPVEQLADPNGLAEHIITMLREAPAEERADIWELNLDSIGLLPRKLRDELESVYQALETF